MASVTSPVGKPMRADARRNYEKLLAAGRTVFARDGAVASLDEVAKVAGVGPGTLYRHFPTRDDLIHAIARDWIDQVRATSAALVESAGPPEQVLADWFTQFVTYLGFHRGAAAKMIASMDNSASPMFSTCEQLRLANDQVMGYAAEAGVLREGVDSRQVMRLVSGVAAVVDQGSLTAEQAEPMLAIIREGITKTTR